MWEITDNGGVIYSGKEDDIKIIYDKIVAGEIKQTWHGDLKLVEIHAIHR